MFNFGDDTSGLAQSPLYARLFDRFAQADPNSAYAMDPQAKKKAFKQGLLQLAVAMSKPNGGNFANSLASGLLAGSNSVNDAQSQYANDAYRNDVMKRTQAEMAANTAKQTALSHLYDGNGNLNPQGVRELQQTAPDEYLNLHDKLYPQATNDWQPKDVNFNGASGTVLWNAKTGEMKTLDGQPFGGQAAAPATGGAPIVMSNALADAVQSVESGGNPYAVSPKGALGPMQTMPGTLRDPGFGVQPARDNSPQEQARVGRDYLAALTGKYGTQGGLAAYNWGPGNWEASIAKYGSPGAALAHAPAETQAYVPKVLSRVGGAPAQAQGLPFGFAPKKGEASTVDKRRQDIADLEANGVKVSPAQRNAYLMTGKMANEDGGALPSDPLAGLDPATAALVKKISTYDALPSSLGRASNRADLLGRAAMLNPDFSEADAQQAYVLKKDMGRSSPTSIGGQVTAINTAAHHLATLLKANKALNDSGATSDYPMVNKAKNAISHGTGAAAVNNWNQAKTFLSEEFAKLIKGGVATEQEIQAIQSNLDASLSPKQRNAAIAQAAEFLQGRISAIQQHSDDTLGGLSRGKSLMTSESKRIFDAVQRDLREGGGQSAQRVRYDAQGNRIP